ncbi:hypothetical protein P170DRAFT_437438 [Aspergillus steynii IBT 23096]|uniref:Ubiquitin 3 binding protein But2 C-terminal domain-containing protein n=1 Tax=Aspergillus steynii IBT 23096 TaxID=1392250 RepID=A0A2I2G444_9EURO|nr:uncharacterized protein P170DRAFT_437438 [Aspergillus steynii IBT 23096]PLB47656.1 hypothetical protein P170DRAFT_437438 [Aspergillus steynii IBT 23096]
MLFRAPVLCMAASLLSAPLAAALPTTERSTLTARDDTQCDVNTNFYVCHINNFRGCCSVDPCALKDGCPDNKDDSSDDDNSKSGSDDDNDDDSSDDETEEPASCPSSGKTTKLFQPHMETLFVKPAGASISTPNLNISKSNTSEWQQTISWKLPSAAKDCKLGWDIPEERNFKSGNNSRVAVYDGDTKITSADFAFWPDTPGARSSPVGGVDCKEDLEFRLELVYNGEYVFLEQNEETGWWVEFSC